jgi:hypothetical protein
MERERLLDLLSALVTRGKLTEDEARDIFAAWEAGDLPESVWPVLEASALALGPVAALTALLAALRLLRAGRVSPGVYNVARRLIAAIGPAVPTAAGGTAATTQALFANTPRAFGALSALPDQTRRELAEGILEAFARESDRRTALLKRSAEPAEAFIESVREAADERLSIPEIVARFPDEAARLGIPERRSFGDVRRFHVAMRQAIREDALALAQLGAGGPLTSEDAARLARAVAEQEAYLRRFVDEVAAREALQAAGGRAAMSRAQVAARARSYGGNARAQFWQAAGARQRAGIVADYIARDDPMTCGPCIDAQRGSPWLPAECPAPGAVCLGGGACRCSIHYREDAAEYARLTGEPLALAA